MTRPHTRRCRIGVLGGSFDPVHKGHLQIAEAALEIFSLTRVLFVPARVAPHKVGEPMTSAYHRYAMVVLALRGSEKLTPCPVELEREQVSYTIDTVEALAEPGNADLCLIMGEDSLNEFHTWRSCNRLLELSSVLAFQRSSCSRPSAEDGLGSLRARIGMIDATDRSTWPRGTGKGVFLVRGEQIDISATSIRDRVRKNQPIQDYVEPDVARYIVQQRLYTAGPQAI